MMSRPFWEGGDGALLGAGAGVGVAGACGSCVCCSMSFCGSSVLIVVASGVSMVSTPRRRVGVVERDIVMAEKRSSRWSEPGILCVRGWLVASGVAYRAT